MLKKEKTKLADGHDTKVIETSNNLHVLYISLLRETIVKYYIKYYNLILLGLIHAVRLAPTFGTI